MIMITNNQRDEIVRHLEAFRLTLKGNGARVADARRRVGNLILNLRRREPVSRKETNKTTTGEELLRAAGRKDCQRGVGADGSKGASPDLI